MRALLPLYSIPSMRLFHLLIFTLLFGCTTQSPQEIEKTPAPGAPQSIGSYSNGCLVGAVSLPPGGEGYQFMRTSRRRFYGHPVLTNFIETFAQKLTVINKNSMLLIGDMAQPRGGKIAGGHDSHQTGLDVDIWYWHPSSAETRSLTLGERETLSAHSVVAEDGKTVNPQFWNRHVEETLQIAATMPAVERIFVHPAIKQKLCQNHKGASWLHKIRPWWKHDDHFHVRLYCPAGNKACIPPAAPIPPGDGCDATLSWWFSNEAVRPKPSQKKEPVIREECKKINALLGSIF